VQRFLSLDSSGHREKPYAACGKTSFGAWIFNNIDSREIFAFSAPVVVPIYSGAALRFFLNYLDRPVEAP